MKLTKQEQKIIGIKRAIRDGRCVYYARLVHGQKQRDCKVCEGRGGHWHNGTRFTCPECTGGKVPYGYPHHYQCDRISNGDLYINYYDDEPITFEGVKLSDIYLTEKAAKKRAQKLTKELNKKLKGAKIEQK